MGIHGLTTYLRENKRHLCKTVELRHEGSAPTVIVIDGWSFIYELQLHPLLKTQWLYGGEYEEIARLVIAAVKAWLAVGLTLHFVFDGPYYCLKFPLLTSRITQSCIQPAQLFFRTSSSSRISPSFLRENRVLPPLIYSACIRALDTLAQELPTRIHVHFADEEADPFAVQLASRLGAYVASHDSDFVILNAEGYRGYVPLDELLWTWSAAPESADPAAPPEDDFGFQPVRKGKKMSKSAAGPLVAPNLRSSLGVLPPELSELPLPSSLTLSLPVYTPTALSAHLQIPLRLLPLAGALVGNDVTMPAKIPRHFFDSRWLLSQRITHVAATLRTLVSAAAASAASPRRGQKPTSGVLDLIDASVGQLLLRDPATMATGERAQIVELVAEGSLHYAVPRTPIGTEGFDKTLPCALHDSENCPLVAALFRTISPAASDADTDAETASDGDADRTRVAQLYLTAYRAGHLSPRVLDVVCRRSYWPRVGLENPDVESPARTVGRPIREWIYALLEDAVGLAEDDGADGGAEEDEDEDEDELIDVEEEDTEEELNSEEDPADPLTQLSMSLQRLKQEQSAATSSDDLTSVSGPLSQTFSPLPRSQALSPLSRSASSWRSGRPRPSVVREHLRRGARLAEEAVSVSPLSALLSRLTHEDVSASIAVVPRPRPVQLDPEDARLGLFLRILGSDTEQLRALGAEYILPAVALRVVVRTYHSRALHSADGATQAGGPGGGAGAWTGGRKEGEKERWTRSEARAFLGAFAWGSVVDIDCASAQSAVPLRAASAPTPAPPPLFSIDNRHIQLVAQVSAALETVEHLAQTLLLVPRRITSPVHCFSGRRFHAALAADVKGAEGNVNVKAQGVVVPEELWAACSEGLEEAFAEERGRKAKKERKKAAGVVAAGGNGRAPEARPAVKRGKAAAGGMFEALAGLAA